MNTLYVLIGIPACGKTSFARKLQEQNPNLIIHSSDAIREELTGSAEDQSHNHEVFELMTSRTISSLQDSHDCVYDATNLSRKHRMALIDRVKKSITEPIYFKAIVFAVDFVICCTRNRLRDRSVSPVVMNKMYKNFQVPSRAEGFDSITVFRDERNRKYAPNYNISHDNPHHTLGIADHMREAYQYALIYDLSPQECMAAQYHDIGKYYCKTFFDRKDNRTAYAHYYGHENVGAYEFLCLNLPNNEDFLLYVALLINHHMDFFKGEHYMDKMRNLYGKKFVKQLQRVHMCDMKAH